LLKQRTYQVKLRATGIAGIGLSAHP